MAIEYSKGRIVVKPEKPKKNFFKISGAYRLPNYQSLALSYLSASVVDIQETGKKGIQVSNRGVLPGDGTWTLWYFGFQGTQPNPITWHSTRIVLKDGAFSFLLPEAMASATYYLFLSRNQNGKEESFPQITVTTPSDKVYNDTLALFNDNTLSIADKSQFKVIYDTIVNTKNSLVILATSYAPKADTEKTSLVNAVTTLTNYVTALVPAYTDFTTNTTIDGALLNGYVTDCNLKSIQLQTKINSLAKASSDDLLDPNKLTTNKKKEVKSKRDSIVNEQTKATTGLDAQASSLTVSSATYDGAITALTTYLNGLTATGGWNSTHKDWNGYTTT